MQMQELIEQTTAIAEFRPFESRMLEFRRRYADVVYDLTVPAQERQARSDRHQIGKVIGELDRSHKAIKAPLQNQVTLIDGERKRIKDDLLEIQGRIKDQIAARDEEIRAEAGKVQDAIDNIIALGLVDDTDTAIVIERHLGAASDIVPEADIYGPRKADAALALRQTILSLEQGLKKRLKYEAEQAELAKLRAEREEQERQAREEVIRRLTSEKAEREAEEKARIAAEAAKRRDEEAAEKLRQSIEAERKAKADAEAVKLKAIDDARKAAKAKAEAEAARVAAIDEARIAREAAALAAKLELQKKIKESEQKAKEAAEAAAYEAKRLAIEAEERRKREIIEADERARREAREAAETAALEERKRIQREQNEALMKANSERKAAERLASNVKHRAHIEREVLHDLLSFALGGPENNEITEAVARIGAAIKEGKIRHVSISY